MIIYHLKYLPSLLLAFKKPFQPLSVIMAVTIGPGQYTQPTEGYGNTTKNLRTATLFTVGFANEIPTGAILLVSDQPMISSGIKTEQSDQKVTEKFVQDHLKIGIDSLKQLINNGQTVKHLRF